MRMLRRAAAVISAVPLTFAGLAVVTATAAQAAVPAVDTDIHINEVFADGGASSGSRSIRSSCAPGRTPCAISTRLRLMRLTRVGRVSM